MANETDDDILQDFLVESREILDALGGQLVELEQRSGDPDLLNAVFRGFHTIKGGAGFLGLNPLVEICHRTEDLFNLLRNGERTVTSELMDHVLQALDVVNAQFDELDAGKAPREAPPALLQALETLIEEGELADTGAEPAESPRPAAVVDPAEAEFDALVEALDQTGPDEASPSEASVPPVESDAGGGDEITEEEFEALLDQLHGAGSHGGVPDAAASPDAGEKEQDVEAGTGEPAAPADKAPSRLRAVDGGGDGGKPPAASAGPTDGRGGKPQRGESSVRVDTARLDDIMNLVGELVLVRNRLATLCGRSGDESVSQAVANLELVTTDLQSAVMKTRMQPIRKVYGRFPRLVRDLARDLGKEIELEMRGEDTDLDKNLVEAIADPLVHLVRNSCDHGIELPAVREAAGKPRQGRLLLSAEQEGDHILLVIADDGGGMDPDKLRQKAIAKGLLDEDSAARLDDRECFNLIFLPGFSTKDEISDVSGRGVGMDVVKTRIAQLNGTIDIQSEPGVGTTLRVTVPLTLAILPTLMVKVRGRKFAMPMAVVSEIFELDRRQTRVVDGRTVVVVRKKAMPLFFLHRWLNQLGEGGNDDSAGAGNAEQVVSVMLGNQAIGLIVDEVMGLEEVVIKPLGAMLHGLPGLAGSTTTGDGQIALIMDIPSLIKEYGDNL